MNSPGREVWGLVGTAVLAATRHRTRCYVIPTRWEEFPLSDGRQRRDERRHPRESQRAHQRAEQHDGVPCRHFRPGSLRRWRGSDR